MKPLYRIAGIGLAAIVTSGGIYETKRADKLYHAIPESWRTAYWTAQVKEHEASEIRNSLEKCIESTKMLARGNLCLSMMEASAQATQEAETAKNSIYALAFTEAVANSRLEEAETKGVLYSLLGIGAMFTLLGDGVLSLTREVKRNWDPTKHRNRTC